MFDIRDGFVVAIVLDQPPVNAQRGRLDALQRLEPAYGAVLDALAVAALPFVR